MKRITAMLFLTIKALFLLGCDDPQHLEKSALQLPQSYQGVLPCAECSGIDTRLFLDGNDGVFVLQEIYRDSKVGDRTLADYGKWTRTGDKLILTARHGEKRYFRWVGENLEMLDRSGLPIASTLNYQLLPREQPLPDTPMQMRGMYLYYADAAIFTDCVTGQTFPMDNNMEIEPERSYSAMQTTADEPQPVFLMLNGHFSMEPAMEGDQTEKRVIPDSAVRFVANQHCDPA